MGGEIGELGKGTVNQAGMIGVAEQAPQAVDWLGQAAKGVVERGSEDGTPK
jgi:hypothetical protein